MNTGAATSAAASGADRLTLSVDSDFRVRPTLARIASHLSVPWREYYNVRTGGRDEAPSAFGINSVWGGLLPGQLWGRLDPETDVDPTAEAAADQLTAYRIDRAILNPGIAPRLSGLSDPRWAADLARATNEWLERTWLGLDDRFLASIVVGARNPRLIVEEIERAGRDPRVVQVVLAFPHVYLGDRRMYSVYEALIDHDLTLLVQTGGAYTGSSRGFTSVGAPTYPYEVDVAWLGQALPHLTSLIAHGTFERYPHLRVSFGGYGTAWLPSLLWQLDTNFTSDRVATPAKLTHLPSETVARHVRFTTERLEASPGRIRSLLSLIDGERLLVFGSGSRGLATTPDELASGEPEDWTAAILQTNRAGFLDLPGE